MNRIRKYGDKWQVLVTPHQQQNMTIDVLMGFWTDEHMNNFYVEEYETLGDAQCKAFELPDIEWIKLIIMYKNPYHDIKNIIEKIIDKENFLVDLNSEYMDPDIAKNVMFDRVLNDGQRFALVNNMNDIISYHIVNPWTQNILEIADALIMKKELKIFKKYVNDGVVHLIGKTDLGTTYEIGIWPTLIYNWARWTKNRSKISTEIKKNTFRKIINLQKIIDSSTGLR